MVCWPQSSATAHSKSIQIELNGRQMKPTHSRSKMLYKATNQACILYSRASFFRSCLRFWNSTQLVTVLNPRALMSWLFDDPGSNILTTCFGVGFHSYFSGLNRGMSNMTRLTNVLAMTYVATTSILAANMWLVGLRCLIDNGRVCRI